MVIKIAQQNAAAAILGGSSKTKTITPNTGGGKAHTSSGGGNASSKTENTDVQNTVRTMQSLMADLGMQLSQQNIATQALRNIKSPISVAEVTKLAPAFSNTARIGDGKASNDGVWGKKTREALLAIKDLVKKLGLEQQVIISEGTEPSPYKIDTNLVELAKSNINNISRIFTAIGLASKVPEASNDSDLVVDKIDRNLPAEGSTKPFDHWGTFPVNASNITDLMAFFRFTGSLNPSFPCESLGGDTETSTVTTNPGDPWAKNRTASFEDYIQKMAREVLNGSIYRLGQDSTEEAIKENLKPYSVRAPLTSEVREISSTEQLKRVDESRAQSIQNAATNSHCVSVFEEIINWFRERADNMYGPIYEAADQYKPSPRPDRENKIGTKFDARLAQYYRDQMSKLWETWEQIKEEVIAALKKKGNSNIITTSILRDALGGKGSGSSSSEGSSNKSRGHSDNGSEVDYGRSVRLKQQLPPLDRIMQMLRFENFRTPSLSNVKAYSVQKSLPVLNINDWDRDSWTSLAQAHVEGNDDAEKYTNFGPWAQAVRKSIQEVFHDWLSGNHNDEEVKEQQKFYNNWINTISAVYDGWRRTYLVQIQKARGLS